MGLVKREKSCGPDKITHLGECYDPCPKGMYVKSYCEQEKKTECSTCPHETFIDTENLLDKCRQCKVCQTDHNLETATECKADQDRKCKCKEGFYCTDLECNHCTKVTQCPPGLGVIRRPTATSDTVCEKCPRGTFSNVTDFYTQCRNHTECKSLGKEYASFGTNSSDSQCTPGSCHRTLSVSLLTGLVVALLIVIIVYICWKFRRHSKMTVKLLDVKLEPASPQQPNTELQYPTLCHDEKYNHNHTFSAVPIKPSVESSDIERDCVAMSTLMLTDGFDTAALGGAAAARNLSSFSRYQSEPQENEWSET